MTSVRLLERSLWCAALLMTPLACRAPPSPVAAKAAPEHFGPAQPRRQGTPLLAREAPNSTVLAMDAGVAGDRIAGLLEIPSDACAVVIARAGASVEDVDLLAYGEDGSVVGTDEAPDKTPALLICPPHPRRIWISARIAAGHGLVVIGAQRVTPSDAERAATLYGIKTGAASGERLGAWPGLQDRIEAHRADLGGDWQDVRRVSLPLDARIPTRVSAQVEAGRCLDVLVLPSDEVGHLELLAFEASGSILGRAESSGRDRYLVLCSASDASVALEIRPQSGRGLGVLLISRTRAGSEPDLDATLTHIEAFPRGDLDSEMRHAQNRLSKSGYAKAKRIASGLLEVGRRSSTPLSVPTGCSRLDVIGATPLRGLQAWAWGGSGALIADAQGGGGLVLFTCGPKGPLRLDLEATLRAGPFGVLLHAEPDTPAALSASPLAGGRLLSHMVQRGVLQRASEVGQVTEVALSPTHLHSLDLTVPFGRCVDLTLALDAQGMGAEVRLVAASTGAQIALGRGPHATSARACSLDAESAQHNLKTRAELRVAVGNATGLFATRMLSPTR